MSISFVQSIELSEFPCSLDGHLRDPSRAVADYSSPTNQMNHGFFRLKQKLIAMIFKNFLNLQELLAFEMTSRNQSLMTASTWQHFRISEKFHTFEWKAAQNQIHHSHKWNYILTKALLLFIDQNNEMKPETIRRYQGLITKFPSYGSYFTQSISFSRSNQQTIDRIENIKSSLIQASNEGFGGESLLLSLFPSTTRDKHTFMLQLKKAIRLRATIAAQIPTKLGDESFDKADRLELAIEAMKMDDWHPLENLVSDITSKDLDKYKAAGYPPILSALAKKQSLNSNFQEADTLYTQALKAYGEYPPVDVLVNAAKVKLALRQYHQADAIYTQVLGHKNYHLSVFTSLSQDKQALNRCKEDHTQQADVFADAARAKIGLKQDRQADALYTQALFRYGDNPPADVLAHAAFAKIHLEISEADLLYSKALSAYGAHPSAWALEYAGYTKFKLKDLDAADALYKQAITTYGAHPSKNCLADAAFLKFVLKKYSEADELYTKALVSFADKPPVSILEGAAEVKFKLKKYREANPLYTQALAAYGTKAPAKALANAARINLALGHYRQADLLFSRVLVAYEPNPPAGVLSDAAHTKFLLKNYSESEELSTKALLASRSRPSAWILANAGYIKLELKKYSEADELYTKALTVFGAKPHVSVLVCAANVKAELKQNDLADALFTQVLEAYGGRPPAKILANAARVKLARRQYMQADLLFSRSLMAYGSTPPAYVLVQAANAKFALKEYRQANALFTRALSAYGAAAPVWVVESAAQAKLQLEEHLQSNSISEESSSRSWFPFL